MSAEAALTILVVAFFAFAGSILMFAPTQNQIGIECVKAGSEWVSRWGIYECVRKGED